MVQKMTYGPQLDPAKIIQFPRLEEVKTDADAHALVMDPKRFPDTAELLFWNTCLRSCTHWHLAIAGIEFSRYTVLDQTEEDDEEAHQARVRGTVLPITGAKARQIVKDVEKFWMRIVGEGDARRQHGYIQTTERRDFVPHATDKPLAQHLGFCLIPVKFDRRHWPQPLGFNRGAWPTPFRTSQEKQATVKLAV